MGLNPIEKLSPATYVINMAQITLEISPQRAFLRQGAGIPVKDVWVTSQLHPIFKFLGLILRITV